MLLNNRWCSLPELLTEHAFTGEKFSRRLQKVSNSNETIFKYDFPVIMATVLP